MYGSSDTGALLFFLVSAVFFLVVFFGAGDASSSMLSIGLADFLLPMLFPRGAERLRHLETGGVLMQRQCKACWMDIATKVYPAELVSLQAMTVTHTFIRFGCVSSPGK